MLDERVPRLGGGQQDTGDAESGADRHARRRAHDTNQSEETAHFAAVARRSLIAAQPSFSWRRLSGEV